MVLKNSSDKDPNVSYNVLLYFTTIFCLTDGMSLYCCFILCLYTISLTGTLISAFYLLLKILKMNCMDITCNVTGAAG